MEINMEKVMRVLITLLEEQENVKIEYTIERKPEAKEETA